MTVTIDDKSGFCFGVVRAIDIAENILNKGGKVYSLGHIVHNRVEVDRLEKMGFETITHEQLSELKSKTVLIRAHGEPPATYQKAERFGIEVVDATCPVVSKLQQRVKRAWKEMEQVNGQVLILGKRGHAEVVGLAGQTNDTAVIIENEEDLKDVDFSRPIHLLSQTTQSLDKFLQIKEVIERKSQNPNLTISDTICRQVSNRYPHLKEFSTHFDIVIFVSGRQSSNGKALFEVCKSANPRSYKIEDEEELQPEWFENCESVGICGATSTPRWIMERVAKFIERKQWGNTQK